MGGLRWYESGGGIILEQQAAEIVKWFWTISDKVLLEKLHGKPLDINKIQSHVLTTDVKDEGIYLFYNAKDMDLDQCKNLELTMLLWNVIATVGNEKVSAVTGGCGLGERIDRGDKLI